MEKIPTAEEFLLKDKNYEELHLDYPKLSKAIQESMIEFAKMHVESALKEASEKAQCEDGAIVDLGFEIISASVDKDSILNSYSLENIK
jgi:hypothetical protein